MPDDLTAELDRIAERNEQLRHRYGYVGGLLALADAKDDVPSLLAAVEAVLKLHKPEGLNRTYVPCERHAEYRGEDRPALARAVCTDCRVVDEVICWQKGCEDYGWPCPTYAALSLSLAGKEENGG